MSALEILRDALFGNPPSDTHQPSREGVYAAVSEIATSIATLTFGAVSVVKETRALLDADLAHVADTLALVYNDATDANNDFYIKVGGSGAGSWTLTTIIADAIAIRAQPLVDAAVEAEASLATVIANALAAAQSEANAAASATTAAEHAAFADAAADIITVGFASYNTKAAATAALGSIAADAYITVLADESLSGARAVYQKSGGVLVLRADLGNITNTSVVTTVAQGDGSVNPKKGHRIIGAGGATDIGLEIDLDNGSMSAIDIHNHGTGFAFRTFEHVGGLQALSIGDGNDLVTPKWIVIANQHLTITGAPGDEHYAVRYWPASNRPNMLSVGADVPLGVEIRGANIGANDQLLSCISGTGYEKFGVLPNGDLAWPRADVPVFIGNEGDGGAAATSNQVASLPLRLNTHNSGGRYGVRVKSEDVGTIGEAWFFVHTNGGLAAGNNGGPLVQNEAGSVVRIGNSADHQVVINTVGQTTFEVAGANVAYITAAGFLPLVDNTKNLGSGALQWNNIYLGNAPIVSSDERIKQDIEDIPEAVLDAWATIKPRQFRYISAVEAKGDAARTHIGYIAQDIKRAFEKAKIDPFKYGILCFDKWDDEYIDEIVDVVVPEKSVTEEIDIVSRKVLNANGRPMRSKRKITRIIPEHTIRQLSGNKIKQREAGEMYSVRYEQVAVLDAALMRRGMKKT